MDAEAGAGAGTTRTLTLYQYAMLLFDAITNKKLSCSSRRGRKIMNLCFKASLFIAEPNESILKYEYGMYFQSLCAFIHRNIADLVTSFILNKSSYLKWAELKRSQKTRFPLQINFSLEHHMVDFKLAAEDWLNVVTQPLSASSSNPYFINIYCAGKGDESWLGLIGKEAFDAEPMLVLRPPSNGILYYGGRQSSIREMGGSAEDECDGYGLNSTDCNHGSIQGRDKMIKHPIESYSAGDWLNFHVDFRNKTMGFYKNGTLQHVVDNENFPEGDCYFLVCLVEKVDAFYIEECAEEQVPETERLKFDAERLLQGLRRNYQLLDDVETMKEFKHKLERIATDLKGKAPVTHARNARNKKNSEKECDEETDSMSTNSSIYETEEYDDYSTLESSIYRDGTDYSSEPSNN